MRTKFSIALLSIMLAFTGVLMAQAPTATLVGQVLDSSNASLAGATVKARNTATNAVRTVTTNSQGEYTIPGLEPGFYDVSITMAGFKELRETRLELSVAQTARLNATLQLGTVTESVSVTSDVGLLNTETSSKGAVITPVEIAEIPLNGRDFNDLAFTVPGVMPAEQGGKGSPYVVNGSRADSSNYFIDGLNDENARDAGAQIQPPLDAIQEFKMETSNYGAQYGMVSGGVVLLNLKSGANRVHGSIFEFVRNDAFDSRNHFDAPGFKSELRRNQFGGGIGGPVVIPHLYDGHDRTFFIVNWESFREVDGQNSLGFIPTPLEQAGNFSASFNSTNAQTPLQLINPFTSGTCATDSTKPKTGKGTFPKNVIDPTLCPINPVAAKLFAIYNRFPIDPSLAPNNYRVNKKLADNWNNVLVKVNQKLSSKDQSAARYLRRWETSTNPFSGSPLGIFGATTSDTETLIGLSETHIFTPNVVNELVGGLIRTVHGEVANDAGTNYALQLGISGTTTDPALEDFPKFSPTGYETIGDSESNPITYVQNKFDYNDVVTWTKGLHTLKIGGDFLHTQYFQPTNSNFNGAFAFNGKATGNALAELYLGIPSSISRKIGTVDNHILDSNYSAFVNDDYKMLPRLTLNLGLRYEFQALPTEEQGQFSNYIPSLGKVILSSAKTVPDLPGVLAAAGLTGEVGLASDYHLPAALIHPNVARFSPRVGFAVRPFNDDRFVVRGGYGLFYTGSRLSAIRTELSGQFPFSISQTVTIPKGGAIDLSNPFGGALKVSGTTSANGYDPNAPSEYLQSYNLTVEHDLGRGVAIEIGYVGSKGTHLAQQIDINQVRNAALPACTGAAGPTCSYRPYAFFNSIKYFSFSGPSSYNAGMVTLRRNFKNGLFFRANYTYGKSLDEASGFNYAGDGGYSGLQNSLNPQAEYGRSDFDIRHVFSGTFVYRPFNNVKNPFVHGWQLAGSGTAYSGAPFTPQLSGPSQDLGQATRPNRVCTGNQSHPNQTEWFNLSCFPQTADQYTFGNSGRNILNGPKHTSLNASVSRIFKIREYGNLEFRFEAFNVTNHTNLSLPDPNVDEPGAGAITAADAPREVQLGARFAF